MKVQKRNSFPSNYSEAFKRMVISEYQSRLSSKATLKRKYGIAGNSCIPLWLKEYGKLDYPNHLTSCRPRDNTEK